jgi:D-mannonate dehydratase
MYKYSSVEKKNYTIHKFDETDVRTWEYKFNDGTSIVRRISHKNGWSGYVLFYEEEDKVKDSIHVGGMGWNKSRAWKDSEEALFRLKQKYNIAL